MTNQQAPEIYALHTVPNKGERPWSGIYAVRADAEHDAKVLRDATGRDWSVVRLVVADTATTPTGPVARYKISYATDDWGMRSSTPSGIPDHAGAWVRYEDHAAELLRLHTENEALRAQQDDAYDHGPQAETVEEAARDVGKWLNERPNRPLDLRHVAMLTHHAKRTAHVQNHAEIEHVAGDVSKNGAEVNMAQQPAPSAAVLDYPHARRFGGCPACGRSDCVAMSCTRTTSDDLLHIAARKQGGKHDNH